MDSNRNISCTFCHKSNGKVTEKAETHKKTLAPLAFPEEQNKKSLSDSFRKFNHLLLWIMLVAVIIIPVTTALAQTPTQRPYIIDNKKYYPIPSSIGYRKQGVASWYGPDFHGHKTSNGEIFNMYGMTAAHKILPMNTQLLVKNLDNGKEIVVRVNDRGPFVQGRIVDLSYTAARRLGIVKPGTAHVEIVALADEVKDRNNKEELVYRDIQDGEFYVQIGAFNEQSNALRLQKRFADAGHKVIIIPYDTGHFILYLTQVYVGHRLERAELAEKILQEKGYRGAFVVRN